jgi:hypothetical protein
METRVKFRISAFRRLPSPYGKGDEGESKAQMFYALCDVTELPDDFPMKTNPREQNLHTSVAKKIKLSLLEEETEDFYLLNRGILLSAKSVEHDNAHSELTITFEDDDLHGNVDGGHTYTIIKQNKRNITPGKQFVKIEILTGVEDLFPQLAAARNTSVQVQDKSIAELENRFDIIKETIEMETDYFDRIIYKQNADGDIDIGDIISILNLFNLDAYPDNLVSFPIQSYSGRSKCIERYIKAHKDYGSNMQNPYVKMKPIMTDIFKLYDRLETNIGEYYRQSRPDGKAKYGSVKGVSGSVGQGKFKSKFYQKTMDYATPTAFLYPILGAFRALVNSAGVGGYSWKSDPFETMDKIGKELVDTTIDRSRSLGNNPNAVGKDMGNWKTLYMLAKMSTT